LPLLVSPLIAILFAQLSRLYVDFLRNESIGGCPLTFLRAARDRLMPANKAEVVAVMSFLARLASIRGFFSRALVLYEIWTQFRALATTYFKLESIPALRAHVLVDILSFSRALLEVPLSQLAADDAVCSCAAKPSKRAKLEEGRDCNALESMFSHGSDSIALHELSQLWALHLSDMSWEQHATTLLLEVPKFLDTLAILLAYCIRPHQDPSIHLASTFMTAFSHIIVHATHTSALSHMVRIGLVGLFAMIPLLPLPLDLAKPAIMVLRFLDSSIPNLLQDYFNSLQSLITMKLAAPHVSTPGNMVCILQTFAFALGVARDRPSLTVANFSETMYFRTLWDPLVAVQVKDAVFATAVVHATLHPRWRKPDDCPRFVQFAALYEDLQLAFCSFPETSALETIFRLLSDLFKLLMGDDIIDKQSLSWAISQRTPLQQLCGIVASITESIMTTQLGRRVFIAACRILSHLCKSPAVSQSLLEIGLPQLLRGTALTSAFHEVKRACFSLYHAMVCHRKVAHSIMGLNIPVVGYQVLVSSIKYSVFLLEPLLAFLSTSMAAYTAPLLARDVAVANATGPGNVNSALGRHLTSPSMALRISAGFIVQRLPQFDGFYDNFIKTNICEMAEGLMEQFSPPNPLSCAICLSEDQAPFVVLPCMHMFHHGCIIGWFKTRRTAMCPNCKMCSVAAYNDVVTSLM